MPGIEQEVIYAGGRSEFDIRRGGEQLLRDTLDVLSSLKEGDSLLRYR